MTPGVSTHRLRTPVLDISVLSSLLLSCHTCLLPPMVHRNRQPSMLTWRQGQPEPQEKRDCVGCVSSCDNDQREARMLNISVSPKRRLTLPQSLCAMPTPSSSPCGFSETSPTCFPCHRLAKLNIWSRCLIYNIQVHSGKVTLTSGIQWRSGTP